MLVFGGCDDKGVFSNDVWALDLECVCDAKTRGKREVWQILATVGDKPKGRHFHSCVLFDGAMWIFGGKSNGYMSDLHKFTLSRRRWECVEERGEAPTPRYGHCAVLYQACMYIFGGYDDFGLKCNDLYKFNFRTATWTKMNTLGKAPDRFHSAAVVHQGSFYVFGGYPGMNEMHEYRFGTRTWSKVRVRGDTPQPRWGHDVVLFCGSMYVFGGTDSVTEFGNSFRFNFESLVWKKLPAEAPPRFFHSVVSFENTMVFFAGKNMANEEYNDLLLYTLDTSLYYGVPCTLRSDFQRFLWNDPTFADVCFTFPKDSSASSDASTTRRVARQRTSSSEKKLYAHLNILWARGGQFLHRVGLSELVDDEMASMPSALVDSDITHTDDGEDAHTDDGERVEEKRDGERDGKAHAKSRPVDDDGDGDAPHAMDSHVHGEDSKGKAEMCDAHSHSPRTEECTAQHTSDTRSCITIPIHDIKYRTVLQTLHYMYTGSRGIEHTPRGAHELRESLEVMKLAFECGLHHLKYLCESAAAQCMRVSSVLTVLRLAERYDGDHLKRACIEMVRPNMNDKKTTPSRWRVV